MTDRENEWEPLDHSYIDTFLRVRDEVVPLHGWRHRPDQMWCYLTPPGTATQPQGWKIHVSATPRSAEDVLAAVSRVLLERRVTFKFARGLKQLRMLLSIRMARGSGGKFITVYPEGPEQFTELLEVLHEATEGMEGPAILSDRRYRPGSLVHYRYGGFSASQQVLDVDGSYTHMLVTPDGRWTQDERNAWYSPPAWAPVPLSDPEPVRPSSERGKSQVLLNDRYVVHEAIRHSNRGGVYRARDERTGQKVVIKEARPFVGAEVDGTDARDYLRNEYQTLRTLEPLGIAVRPVDLFEYQGHLFLAEEEVPGVTLRTWVDDMVRRDPGRMMPFDRVLDVARRLVDMAAAVHDKGLVFRDLTPNNVMIKPDGELVLIDTEFLAVPNEQVTRVQTLSYAAPEEANGPVRYPAPRPVADLYSVGATLFHLCTGVHAYIPPEGRADESARSGDAPPDRTPGGDALLRSYDERVRFLVRAVAADYATLRAFAPIVLGLLRERPEQRLSLLRVREMLEDLRPARSGPRPMRLPAADQERLLTDGRAQLVTGMTPDSPDALWPAPPVEGRMFDTLALQAGSAGTLEVMRRGVRATGDARQRSALRTGLAWLDEKVDRSPRQLPGLYFGRGGTYWAMYEAATELGDGAVQRRSIERVKSLPVVWSNPDLTHGVPVAGWPSSTCGAALGTRNCASGCCSAWSRCWPPGRRRPGLAGTQIHGSGRGTDPLRIRARRGRHLLLPPQRRPRVGAAGSARVRRRRRGLPPVPGPGPRGRSALADRRGQEQDTGRFLRRRVLVVQRSSRNRYISDQAVACHRRQALPRRRAQGCGEYPPGEVVPVRQPLSRPGR